MHSMKKTLKLFKCLRDGNLEGAKKAYSLGGEINQQFDRWIVNKRQCWGFRIPVVVGGIYTGFSMREIWPAPQGIDAEVGDSFLIILFKCGREEEIIWALSLPEINLYAKNRSGHTVIDVATRVGLSRILPSSSYQDSTIYEAVVEAVEVTDERTPPMLVGYPQHFR